MTFNFRLFFKSWYYALTRPRHPAGRLTPKRLLVLVWMLIFYPLWQAWIRLGWLLDALFWRAAARPPVREPVFIIGNFRSGTTFLHRLLAADTRFTSTTLWELYFAPSIAWRKLFYALAHLDARFGSPIGRVIKRSNEALSATYPMHKTSLFEPEEDDLLGYHIWSTYLLVSFFPFREIVRPYLYYDRALAPQRRRKEMRYYRSMIQRHLFVHSGRQYLSKSPSNTPKIRALVKAFPDARFIYLARSPLEMTPSTQKFFYGNWRIFGSPAAADANRALILEQCRAWYAYSSHTLNHLPSTHYIIICYEDLIHDPAATIARIYHHFGWDISPAYRTALKAATQRARSHNPTYAYSLEDMGLNPARLKGALWTAYQKTGCPHDSAEK